MDPDNITKDNSVKKRLGWLNKITFMIYITLNPQESYQQNEANHCV